MANYLTTDTDLTSVANAIRTKGGTSASLAFPAEFISAIQAIPTGGGGNLGGLANMADVTNPEYLLSYALSCMKNGATAGGTITRASNFPDSEVLFLSTGLTVVHGFILASTSLNRTSLGSGNSNIYAIFVNSNMDNYPVCNYDAFALSQGLNRAQQFGTYGTQNANGPTNGTLRLDGGDVYYTARYNNNNNYQIIRSGIEYDWLAW